MDKINVESSVIKAVKYSGEHLVVYFVNGSIYVYYGVSEKIFSEFLAAYSKGGYFLDNIKGRYAYVKI